MAHLCAPFHKLNYFRTKRIENLEHLKDSGYKGKKFQFDWLLCPTEILLDHVFKATSHHQEWPIATAVASFHCRNLEAADYNQVDLRDRLRYQLIWLAVLSVVAVA
jgi:hypothetical protein